MKRVIEVDSIVIVTIIASLVAAFLIGVAVGKAAYSECEPKIVTQEVEKIVYKDTPETLEYVEALEDGLDAMSEAYLVVFDVAEIEMDDNNMRIGQGFYDVYNFAKAWLEK